MRWPGENRQEACSLQKLPEAGFWLVEQEQVYVCHFFCQLFFKTYIRWTYLPHKPRQNNIFIEAPLLFDGTCTLFVKQDVFFLTLQTLLCGPDQLVPGDQSHKPHV